MSQYTVTKKNLIPSDTETRQKYAVGVLSKSAIQWIGYLLTIISFTGSILFPQYWIFPYIGYSAFPMFTFFIAEGCENTHSRFLYGIRLWTCGIITQLFYYPAFHTVLPKFSWFSRLNPVLTYFLGYLLILSLDTVHQEFEDQTKLRYLIQALILIAGLMTAHYFPFYHDFYGVAAVVIFWIMREDFWDGAFVNWILLTLFRASEMWGLPGYLITGGLYNHKKGRTPSWIFYTLFPVLFAILWILSNLKQGRSPFYV